MLYSLERDVALGRKLAPEVARQCGGRIEDAVLQNYIAHVGEKIAAFAAMSQVQFHYTALNDKSVNAFALPGGYIFITKGMLKELGSEAQLAGVLAHETAHVVGRDAAEAMSKQMGVDLLLSLVTSEKTSKSVVTLSRLAWDLQSMRFSREDETQADLRGLDYMARAGYNPYAMVKTMDMLSELHKHRPIEFLSTHPNPETRRTILIQTIQQRYHNTAQLKTESHDYQQNVLDRL